MGTKRHKPEEVVAKLRQVDVLVSQGQSVAEAIRAIGVTEVTYYRWRQEYGRLKSDARRPLPLLLGEGRRQRRVVEGCGQGGRPGRLGKRQHIHRRSPLRSRR